MSESPPEIKLNRGNFEATVRFLEAADGLRSDQTIVEVGSGTGNLVATLRDRGLVITGTEINDAYIAFARSSFGVNLKKMDGQRLDFPDDSVDTVFSFDVFEHIPDSREHLREVSRILKPGGRYLFHTPNKLLNVPFEIMKERSFSRWKTYHRSVATYWRLRRLLQQQGFSIQFFSIPVVNDHFRRKLRRTLGPIGLGLLAIVNPDRWPLALRTNFFVAATKPTVGPNR